MLFITMSFTFQTKTVTRNRYIALEGAVGGFQCPGPSKKLLHCYKHLWSISSAQSILYNGQDRILLQKYHYYIISGIHIILLVLVISSIIHI